MRRPVGFTLIELLVTLAIVGVVVAVSARGVLSGRAITVRQAAQKFVAEVARARFEGMRRDASAGVHVDGTGFGQYVVFVDVNNNGQYDANLTAPNTEEVETVTMNVQENSGVKLTDGLTSDLLFDSRGVPITPSGASVPGNGTVTFLSLSGDINVPAQVTLQGGAKVQ